MAGRRLNKNLVIALTLGTFALMIGLAAIMLGQLQKRDPKYFVDLAQNARDQSHWPQAALFYKEAYDRSRDALYLVHYGEMLLNDGEVRKALAAWQQALINEPDLLEGHVALIELLYELVRQSGSLRQWERLQEAADRLIEVEAEKTRYQEALAHHAKGMALIHLKNQDESFAQRGIEELEIAAGLAWERVEYAIDLAVQYVLQERVEDGKRLLQQRMEQHASPGSASSRIRLAYAQLLVADQRFEEAKPLFKESLMLAQADSETLYDVRLGYAVYLSRKWARAKRDDSSSAEKLWNESESIIKENIEADPDRYEAYIQLAVLYKSAKRYEDIVDVCEDRLKRGLSRKGIKASRNRMHTFTLMIHASQACVSHALQLSEDGDMEAKDPWLQRAWQYLLDARGEFPDHPRVSSQSGRIKVARGEFRDALKDLRSAEEGYRSFDAINWENKIILARIHLRLNESGAARELLEEVARQARRQRSVDTAFWVVYAQTLFQAQAYDRALSIVDRVLRMDEDHADALRLKAAIYERRGQHQRAGELIETVTGDAVVRAILTARQFTLEDNTEAALNVLQETLKTHPAEPRVISALVAEWMNLGRDDQARDIVANALQVKPDDLVLQKLEVYVRRDLSAAQRERAMLEVIESEPDAYKRSLDLIAHYFRVSDRSRALEAVNEAQKHLIAGDTPLAKNTILAHHRALLRAKIQLAVQLDDTQALEEARDAARKYNVDGTEGKSILGYYYMGRREFEPAIHSFRAAIDEQPTDTWSLGHLGRCLQVVGRNEEARDAYERAVHANPNEGLAHKGLALLAKNRNDEDVYQNHLDRCEQLIPNDPWVQDQLLVRREQADPRGAIERRETLLVDRPDDADNIRRLAGLYEQIKETAKADHYHELLLQKKPDDQATVLAVSAYYRRTDRPARSLEVVTRYARSRLTPEERANAQILIATHYIAQQELDRAEDVLLEAVHQTDTLELAQSLAEFYLKSLKQPRDALPWIDRAVERAKASQSPLLAQILLTRMICYLDRGIDDTKSARRDVEEFSQRFPGDPRYLLWDSEIHARRGHIDQAVTSLTEYIDSRPGDVFALYQRAGHYITQGKLGSAVEDLQTIKRINPLALHLDPRILLANLYGRRGQKDLWLDELESMVRDAPDSDRALEALVNAYLRESRMKDADRLVTKQINQTENRPEARWYLLRGRISFLLGQMDQALADYRHGAEINGFTPPSLIQVLDVYIRTKRYADGLVYFQQHTSDHPKHPILLSRRAVLLALNRRHEEAVGQFRSTLMLALQEVPDAVPFVTGSLQIAFPNENSLTDAIHRFETTAVTGLERPANELILVRLYRLTDRIEEALTVLDRSIRVTTDRARLARLYQEKAELHQMAGDPENTRHAYESSLEYDEQNWMTLNNLAYVLVEELNEPDAALRFAQKAVQLDENPASLDTLGWIYASKEKYAFAIAELSRAIRLDPNQALALYHLGEVYRRAGRFKDAASVLDSSLLIARESRDNKMIARVEQSIAKTRNREQTP